MKNFVRLLTLCYCFFIAMAIYQANTGAESTFAQIIRAIPHGDKVGHFVLFGILTLLLNIASGFRMFTIARVRVFAGTTLVIVFVVLEELSQGFVTSRTMDIRDLLADMAGISLCTYVSWYLARQKSDSTSSFVQ